MANILKNKLFLIFVCLISSTNLMSCNIRLNVKDFKFIDNIEYTSNKPIEYEQGDVLPLGTVISLKEKEDKLVIIGWMQKSTDNNNKEVYDYIACIYPKGILTGNDTQAFNEEDIDKVYFNGYEDKAEIERNKELIKHKNSILESK